MNELTTIGVDLAKSVFQLHGTDAAGKTVLTRQLRRSQMLEFFRDLPGCLIGLEACAGAHYWARTLGELGHEVRLMQPSYVKGYVKRGKTDRADAAAICEAVTRPSMRFVPVKSKDTQGQLVTHRVREFLVRLQTQLINAIRAHLGEFGIVIPNGIQNVGRVIEACDHADLPAVARQALNLLADQLLDLREKIAALTADLRNDASGNEAAQRLQTIPGIGPITASAFVASLPDISDFRSARDLSAWLGLTPQPHSSGGKERLGRISKQGSADCFIWAPSPRSARGAGESPAMTGCGRLSGARRRNRRANRTARMIYALLRDGTEFNAAKAV